MNDGGPNDTLAPLRGRRVVCVEAGLAVAILARLLADQGAEVEMVAPPSHEAPDATRPPSTNGSAAPLPRLLRDADVLIDSLTPERARERGLERSSVRRQYPRLVHLRMPCFPAADPEHAERVVGDAELGTQFGLYTDVNAVRSLLGLGPCFTSLPYASVYGAIHGATAICAALYARSRGSEGRTIEVPLVSAGLSAMASQVMRVHAQPMRYDQPSLPRWLRHVALPMVQRALPWAPASMQDRASRSALSLTPPFMDSYVCRDGRLLYLFAMEHAHGARALLEHLGLLDGLRAAGLTERNAFESAARDNIREGGLLSRKWRRRVRQALAARLRERDAEQWERSLGAAGFACTVQRSLSEWLRLPEVDAGGLVRRDGGPGGAPSPGPHVWLRAVPGARSPKEPAPRRAGGLLSGLRVLDLSAVVAGPVAARTLGEYGAEVTKIVSPRPRHGPRITCWYAIDTDRGKRNLLVDLKTEGGRAVLDRLVCRSDVLVHNFRDQAVERLGLTPARLAALRPGIVVCRLGAFRGPRAGPWADRRGYDPVLQASTGVMQRYSAPGRSEHHGVASCVDYLTGYSGAFAVMLALVQRAAEGTAVVAETALAQSAQLIQWPHWSEDIAEPSASASRVGIAPLRRLVRARDEWVLLSVPDEHAESALGLLGVDDRGPGLESAVARAVRGRTTAALRELLARTGAIVWPVRSLSALREEWLTDLVPGDPIPNAAGAQVVRRQHPAGGLVDTLAPCWTRIEGDPLRVPSDTPKPGADTKAVLKDLGFDEPAIERLRAEGAIAFQLADDYLP